MLYDVSKDAVPMPEFLIEEILIVASGRSWESLKIESGKAKVEN
jgi:hypothetical protein